MTHKRAILIAGPTASGKSTVAAAIAANHNGIVVNADSIQVYRELQILSARPSKTDESKVPHRLYGYVPISETYSVAQWLQDIKQVLDDPQNKESLFIIVGGTGLYFKAFTEGLSPIPEIPHDIRQKYRDMAAQVSTQHLFRELQSCDPLTAQQLRPSDTQRLVRALEVFAATGRPLAEWQKTPGQPVLTRDDYEGFVISPPRAEIRAAAEARFDKMMEAGALEEARTIKTLIDEMQLEPKLPGLKALGLKPLIAQLSGEISLDAAVEQAKHDTSQYIKRQQTWFRRYNNSWTWLSTQEIERIARNTFAFIDF